MEGERLSDPALGPEARTAADRVLSTPELLRAVFDVLGDDGRYELSGSGQLNRNTLASCARVCRDFSVHALDVLWTNNHDLLTLLKILPSFQFLNGQWWLVEADIPSAEWMNFRTYAARMRTLLAQYTEERSDLRNPGPLVWTILARNCQGEPLLPHLHFLNIRLPGAHDVWQDALNHIVHLLSPGLHTVNLDFDPEPPQDVRATACNVTQILLKYIAHAAPHLTTLRLTAPIDQKALDDIGTHFPALTTLDLGCSSPPVDIRLLRAISTVKPLIDLSLMIRIPDAELHLTEFDLSSAFQDLRTLSVDGGLRDASHFIQRIRPMCLDKISLFVTDWDPDPSHTRISASTSLLSKLCAFLPPCLRDFMLVICDQDVAARPDLHDAPQTYSDILAPLLRFKRLERVVCIIRPTGGPFAAVDATDRCISVLAEAWPNLRILRLEHRSSSPLVPPAPSTYPTVQALVSLARHCPQLSDLSLPRLNVSLPLTDESEPVPLMNHPLESLSIQQTIISWNGDSWVSSSQQFAMLLDRLFPRLLWDDIRDVNGHLCREAHDFLEAIRGAREHDRLRGGL